MIFQSAIDGKRRRQERRMPQEIAPTVDLVVGAIRRDPAKAPEPTVCSRCSEPWTGGGVCWSCIREQEREQWLQKARALRRAESGIAPRHARMTWNDLREPREGAAAWHKAVDELRRRITPGSDALVLLCGGRGTGKTLLGSLLVGDVLAADLPARIVPVIEVLGELKHSFGSESGGELPWLRKFDSLPVVVFDEASDISSEWEHRMFRAAVDRRYRQQQCTLIIGNIAPAQAGQVFGDSVCSRLNEAGGIIETTWSSFRS